MRYPGAVWKPSANFWTGRGGISPKWIIDHGTAGPNAVAWLTSPDNTDSSAHFVITVDGTVYQLVDTDDSAWGNGVLESGHDPWWTADINPNLQTISIEHEKLDVNNANPITDAQKKSSFALQTWLCNQYHIRKAPANADGGITGHYSISPGTRMHCPGNYPWNDLWAALGITGGGSTTMATVPQGWTDDGTTLTAPNGIKVVLGFRDFVLANGATWGKDNWPLEEEHNANPLEYSNPGLGGGRQQTFRLCMLGYIPGRPVLVEFLGQEFMYYKQIITAYQQQEAQMQAQIAALTQQLQNSTNVTPYKNALQQIASILKSIGVQL